jgi:hypothetical protein
MGNTVGLLGLEWTVVGSTLARYFLDDGDLRARVGA